MLDLLRTIPRILSCDIVFLSYESEDVETGYNRESF